MADPVMDEFISDPTSKFYATSHKTFKHMYEVINIG